MFVEEDVPDPFDDSGIMSWRARMVEAVDAMLGNCDTMSGRRLVQVTLLSAGLLAVGFLKPPTAIAAVIYKIQLEPADPGVGERVAISVATFEADSLTPGATLDPFPLDNFPWSFVADSPSGESVEISLVRDADSRNRWTGTFVFTEEGRWEIGLDKKHLGSPPDPALGARLDVVVGSDSGPNAIALLAAFAVAFPLVVLAGLWLRARGVR